MGKITGPFRGSLAVRRGLVSKKALAGPGFRRLYPNIYLDVTEPSDLAARSRAVYLLVAGRGTLGGDGYLAYWTCPTRGRSR